MYPAVTALTQQLCIASTLAAQLHQLIQCTVIPDKSRQLLLKRAYDKMANL